MKQEDKDLLFKAYCMYLPYGVEFEIDYEDGDFSQNKIQGIVLDETLKDEPTVYLTDYEFIIGGTNCKPILLPLSQLTEEIEHNGEKFTPACFFEIGDDSNESVDYGQGNVKLIGLLSDMAEHNFIQLSYIPFSVVQKLLEWHFDIYGLIGKGLAVPKNN
jgi:hypothetical protein